MLARNYGVLGESVWKALSERTIDIRACFAACARRFSSPSSRRRSITVRTKLKNGELKNRKLKTRHRPLAGGSLAPEPPTRSGEDPLF